MVKQLGSMKTGDASRQLYLERVWIASGAAFGLLAVVAGAAGVHALRGVIDADALNTFETAVRFQMFHALALLAIGPLSGRWTSGLIDAAGWLFIAGVLIFSGSLYILAITGIGVFGAIAPIGGLCLMSGWAMLIIGAMRKGSGEE
ncbi:MAG: DUF423 domain-containing protein [Chloroflexi bacterium]|nr:DUF423 domain-containing protein [Chloroflexota bacterium]